MKILCPHCGVKGSADDSYCDRKVKCPKCKETFRVQAEMALAVDGPPLPVPESQNDLSRDLDSGGIEATAETIVEEKQEEVAQQDDDFDWSDLAAEIDQQITDGAPEDKSTDAEQELDGLLAELTAVEEEPGPAPIANLSESVVEVDEENKVDDSPGEPEEPASDPADSEVPVEVEPYGLDKEQCWQCGKEDSVGEPFIAKDGRLYCTNCLPEEDIEEDDAEVLMPPGLPEDESGQKEESGATNQSGSAIPYFKFSIGEAIRKAWAETKGAKGSIWAGSAIMYLVLLVLVAGGTFLLPTNYEQLPGAVGIMATVIFQVLIDVLAVLFTAGLLYIGIRKVAGDPISWRMIGRGFSCAGKIILATILQTILVTIGFLLLILPGIYLTVGYVMTIPLIVDKDMTPWQAMETSRKAIHRVWWKIFGLFLVMGVICLISLVPLGLGLIWVWPMWIILAGVVYRYLFGGERKSG